MRPSSCPESSVSCQQARNRSVRPFSLLDRSTNPLQAYKARADADKERYAREFKATFNRDPGFVQQKSSP